MFSITSVTDSNASAPRRAGFDVWALICLLAPLPLLLHSIGAPLGEPVADDFDFLHHARFHPGQWLDGGGSSFYWRPLARQAWYALTGPLLLDYPAVVAGVQALMLGLAALLLYRTLRTRMPAPWAAAAAIFPFTMESARQLIATSTNVQDLGAVLLSAVALHEASRRRMATALLALLGSLLCKEMAVFVAPLLAWVAPGDAIAKRDRWRWTFAALALVGAWGALYASVVRNAGLLFARELYTDADVIATPWLARYAWALVQSAADALSLGAVAAPSRGPILASLAGIAAIAIVAAFARGDVRARLRASLPLALSGFVWFFLVTALLADVYPEWRSFRSTFGLIGLGVAFTALLAPVHAGLLAALALLKLVALGASPSPPLAVSTFPHSGAVAISYPELVRVQRFTGLTHRVLLEAVPELPPGGTIGRHLFPHLGLYGFANHRALQVWYRDSTVRWLPFGDFLADTAARPATIVQYESGATREVALVDPLAMRALVSAGALVSQARWTESLVALTHAESLQRDSLAHAFFGIAADQRSLALAALGENAAAEREALRALRLWSDAIQSRYVLARLWAAAGQFEAAAAKLDTVLEAAPADSGAARLRRRLREEIARRSAAPR